MASAPTKIAHTMTGTPNGDTFDLGDEFNQVRLTAKGPCRARVQCRAPGTSAPSAPGSDPIAANGSEASSGWVDMVANDTVDFDPDVSGNGYKYRYVEVWELAGAAGLTLIAEAK